MRYTAAAFIFATFLATHAYAQEPAAVPTLDLSVGAVQFDLNGTGTDVGAAIRHTHPLGNALGLNLGVLVAFPAEDVGRRTLLVPELQLHYHWRAGMVRPFAGGGIGTAIRTGAGDTQWDLSLAGAAGARIELPGRVAILGEFRLRGFEHDFAGTTAEWMGGVSWLFD